MTRRRPLRCPGFILRALQRTANAIITRREPDFLVGSADNPYLLRWFLIPRNPVLNIYLHRFLRDDDDRALHDHPWHSVSFCLDGTMVELFNQQPGQQISLQLCGIRVIYAGEITYRPAAFAHRIELLQQPVEIPSWLHLRALPGFADAPRLPATTLFITGPRVREWGFLCPKGWTHWKEFTKPGAKGEIGQGCAQ